jgi:hypothetical protein
VVQKLAGAATLICEVIPELVTCQAVQRCNNMSGSSRYNKVSGISRYMNMSGSSRYNKVSGISKYMNMSGSSRYSDCQAFPDV